MITNFRPTAGVPLRQPVEPGGHHQRPRPATRSSTHAHEIIRQDQDLTADRVFLFDAEQNRV